MATSPPRPSLPPAWSFIASKLPDDIRAVLEDMVMQMEDKVRLIDKSNDKLIITKDRIIVQMEHEMEKINEFNEMEKNRLCTRTR